MRILAVLFLSFILLTATTPVLAEPINFDHRLGYSMNEISSNYFETYVGNSTIGVAQGVIAYGSATAQTSYNFLSAASAAIKISSSDANDTGEIKITYLDSNWDRQDVTETLTGQTQVTLSVTAIRILKAECVWSGAQDNTNQGVVYVYTGAATSGVPDSLSTCLAVIPAGRGASVGAVTTIPRNVARAAVTQVIVNALAASQEVYLCTRDSSQTYPINRKYGPFDAGSHELLIPLDDKHDVWLEGKYGTDTVNMTAGFTVYYKKQ